MTSKQEIEHSIEEILKDFLQEHLTGNIEQTYGDHKKGTAQREKATTKATHSIKQLLEQVEIKGRVCTSPAERSL